MGRVNPAQHVIMPKGNDDTIGTPLKRPERSRPPPSGGIPRHPSVDDRDGSTLRFQPGVQLRHEALLRREPKPLGEAVAKSNEADLFCFRGAGHQHSNHNHNLDKARRLPI